MCRYAYYQEFPILLFFLDFGPFEVSVWQYSKYSNQQFVRATPH